jgi:hypothetical protein
LLETIYIILFLLVILVILLALLNNELDVLLETPFSLLSIQEKLEIIKLGAHQPMDFLTSAEWQDSKYVILRFLA